MVSQRGTYSKLQPSANRCRNILSRSHLSSILMTTWKYTGIFSLILIMFYNYCGGYFLFSLVSLAILAFFYELQDKLLYYPSQPPDSRHFTDSPTNYGLPLTESKLIDSSDGVKVHIMFIGQPTNDRVKTSTVLFLHGNAGNIGHRLQNMAQLFHFCKVNILLLEYRGYGKSEGTPYENGLYKDLGAGINYLINREDIDSKKIVLMGRSLGGGVATSISDNPQLMEKVSAVILENTFTSIPNMGVDLFGLSFISYLPRFVFKNKFESISRINELTVPTLFLSGQNDTLVPPKMMYNLYYKSGARIKQFIKLEGGHNDSWLAAGYYQAIAKFLEQVNASNHPTYQ